MYIMLGTYGCAVAFIVIMRDDISDNVTIFSDLEDRGSCCFTLIHRFLGVVWLLVFCVLLSRCCMLDGLWSAI